MEQPVEISLSEKAETPRHRTLQLYPNPSFQLPELGDFEVEPFPQRQRVQPDKQTEFDAAPTYAFTNNPEYERIMGTLQCYPLGLCLGGKYMAVASKSEVIVFELPDFSAYTRIPVSQVVTALDAQGQNIAIGLSSGRILCYSMLKKSILTQISYYSSFILRVKWLSKYRLCAIDSLGSFVFFDINTKTIMEKTIVTSVDNTPVYEDNRERTRDKVKRFWKNIISKEEKEQQPEKHSHCNFSIIHNHYENFVDPKDMLCAVFRKNTVKVALLGKDKLNIKCEQQLFEGRYVEEVGVFTLGTGGFDVSNHTYLLLAVSIQSTLNYFKYVRVDDQPQWHHVFTIDMGAPLHCGSFISNNLLMYLTDRGVQLGNVGQLAELVTAVDLGKFGYIDFFNSEEGLNINKKIVYRNALRTRWSENIFACLEGKRLVLGTVQSWQSYLGLYTADFRWEQAMAAALKIYKGSLKKLANINQNLQTRKQQMMTFFEKITITFLTFELKKQPETHRSTIRRAIDFMLATENYGHLFTTVLQAVRALGHHDLFFEQLQEPIAQGKVRVIPSDALVECIQFYKARGLPELLQKLVLGLDLGEVDLLVLLETCLRFQLFRSLIHICVAQEDWVTPIVKLCGLVSLQPELRPGETQICDILFWYIRGCLQGVFIECYEPQKYLLMLQKLITYVFVPVTLRVLCKAKADRFFSLVNKFLQPKILQLVLENSERFLVKGNVQQDVFQKGSSTEFLVYQRLLKNVIFTQYLTPQAVPALEKFIVYLVLKNQFHFNQTFKVRAVLYFVDHPRLFQGDDIQINAYLMRLFDSALSKAQRPSQLCESIISKIYNGDNSQVLAESLCYLYHQLGKFAKCFELYIRMHNPQIRERVLLYLEQNIELPELRKEVLSNIISLVKISEDKALRLLAQALPMDCEEIINKLAAFPNYQLKYLQLVFQSQHALTDELKLIHLGIVIKYEKQDVETFLKKMDYPLDEAYRICEQANHKPAMAFLACKKGMILEGALILADVFCQVSDDVVRTIAKRQNPDKTLLYSRLRQMLAMCAQQYARDPQQGQTVWFRCLEKVFKHIKIQNLVKENVPLAIRELLNEIVTIILNELCTQVNVDFFVTKFTKHFSSLPFNVFSKGYLLIKDRLKYSQRVLTLTKTLLESDHLNQNIVIVDQYRKGLAADSICSQCQLPLRGMSVAFPCGHSLHFDCCGQYRCPLCLKDLQDLLGPGPKVLSCQKVGPPPSRNASAAQKLRSYDTELQAIYNHLRG